MRKTRLQAVTMDEVYQQVNAALVRIRSWPYITCMDTEIFVLEIQCSC